MRPYDTDLILRLMTLWAQAMALALLAAAPPSQDLPPPAGVDVGIDDPRGRALSAFHSALRRTARGLSKTRIIQFGASHTAADILTGYMRTRLQARFGDGGIGFFMPARPWRTYRHQKLSFKNPKTKKRRWNWEYVRWKRDWRKDGLYGLAGMAVSADSKKQWQQFGLRNSAKASRLEVFFHKQRRGGDLYVKIGAGRRVRVRTRGRPGLGSWSRTFPQSSPRFELRPRGNGDVRVYGAVLERREPGVVIDTAGINGARAASQLYWDYALWEKLMKRRDPDLVILAYGTNEAGDHDQPIEEYATSLRKVVKRVRRAAPQASCVLFGPTDRPVLHDRKKKKGKKNVDKTFSRRSRVAQVVETQRTVSHELGCGFFDAVAATGGEFSIVSWADREPRLAYRDYVHFTARGYRVLSDLFVDGLLRDFSEPKRAQP